MKPKARYDERRGLWLVYGGNFRDGWCQDDTLGKALANYQLQLLRKIHRQPLTIVTGNPSVIKEWALNLIPTKPMLTPVQIIEQLEEVIEKQKLEIAHCHAVCDELRQQLNQSRRSIWGLTPASGPHWSGKQS